MYWVGGGPYGVSVLNNRWPQIGFIGDGERKEREDGEGVELAAFPHVTFMPAKQTDLDWAESRDRKESKEGDGWGKKIGGGGKQGNCTEAKSEQRGGKIFCSTSVSEKTKETEVNFLVTHKQREQKPERGWMNIMWNTFLTFQCRSYLTHVFINF